MPDLPGERIRRDDKHRAPGMSQAVPAHRPRDQPHPDALTASTQDQHVIRTAGDADQDPARGTSLDLRLHHRIVGNFPPHRDKRIPKPLAGHLVQGPAQLDRGCADSVICPRRRPRNNGNQQ